jgi:putative hemin transport protein
LKPEFKDILTQIPTLGYVMALSRNDEVVHERKGEYKNWSSGPHASLFVGDDIDLRIFLNAWGSAFAVIEGEGEKSRYSLQFFGKDGEAVHKIYLTSQSDFKAYEKLVEDFRSENQSITEDVVKPQPVRSEMADSAVDVESFREDWLGLLDTHDFYPMLGKYRVSRTQALRLAPDEHHAHMVPNNALRWLFEKVAELEIPVMVFVGNKGMIQIHTGQVKNLMDQGDWFNVIDPEFNLHLLEPGISESWIVRKPTRDGIVTALELYNKKKELIVTIFGKRKPGIPELEDWRNIITRLEVELTN